MDARLLGEVERHANQLSETVRASTRYAMLLNERDQIRQIVQVTNLPVAADLESGFGDEPAVSAETIRLAAEAGAVGSSIEDAPRDRSKPPYDLAYAAGRVAAAVAAARALPFPFRAMHVADLAKGLGEAPLPQALAGKYPRAGYLWAWQFVFPSSQHCRDPYTGRTVRFHVHEKTLQRAVKYAARHARIGKPVGCHTFRHAFATHLLEAGHNIRVVQQLMGHKDVETTMIYPHVMDNSLAAVRSPADAFPG